MVAGETAANPPEFDPAVVRAMARWPDVPECHGWLALDRRGGWRLRGEPLDHPNIIAFIGRNYAADAQGRWFFQNGPQRVYVALEYTPWIYRVDGRDGLVAHTGRQAGAVERFCIDDEGHLLALAALGPGLIHACDVPILAARIAGAHGRPLDDDEIEAALANPAECPLTLRWNDRPLPLEFVPRAQAARRFGYRPDPAPSP
ncbi:MAG: DUF2946 family protein [Gammaproteobacteria bacterium]